MQISLPPDLEEFVAQKVKAGFYPDPDAVINEALIVLREPESAAAEFTPEHETYLRQEIQKGADQLDRGEGIVIDRSGRRDLLEKIKARGQQRLDARQKPAHE